MVRKVSVPFSNVNDLRYEYGNKFLVLTDCSMSGLEWDGSGVLSAVCDSYRESLEVTKKYTTDMTKTGEVQQYHFEYIAGVTKGDFKYS
jgi:hypothetical protein